jgi:tetratricopeptide (TPR) repeat protein
LSLPARARGFLAHPAFHVLLVLAVALIAYSNTFDVPFILDDKPNIRDNPLIKDFIYFKDPSLAEEVPIDYNIGFTYRIVGHLTFALNYRIHGLDVRGYHVVNLAVHVANALLIYWLVLLTFMTPFGQESSIRDHARIIALFSGVLFVVHPIHTQAVTYIVQRLASLTTLFYLLSLALYIRCRLSDTLNPKSIIFYVLALFSAVLAMKTKEIAFTLPFIVLLYEFMFLKGPPRKRAPYLVPILLTILIIPLSLVGSDMLLGDVIGEFQEATRRMTEMPRSDYLFTQFRVISTYIRLLFLPVNQSLDYDYPIFHSFFDLPVLFSFLFLASIFGLGIFLLHRSKTAEPAMRLVSFGILWFFITLSIESSIIPIADVVFEHRAYLPNAGFIMAAGTAAFLLPGRFKEGRSRTAAFSLLALAVLLFSAATYSRNTVWQNRLELWADVLEKSPRKARSHNNIASAYESEGDMDMALKHYETAAMLKPDSVPIQNNLANAYVESEMFEKAIERFSLVLRMEPDYVQAQHDLGSAYYKMGRTEKAIEQYERVIETNPKFMNAYINLGVIYNNEGRPDKAAGYLKQVVALRPDIAEAHYNLANSHAAMARFEEAIKEYSIALDLAPGNATAHYNIGNAYLSKGLFEKAIEHYRRAIRLKPDYAGAHVNLGIAYKNTGRTDMAIEHYEKAVRLEPNNPDANYNLANAYMKQSMVDDAIPHYEKTVILRPNDPDAHNNLAIAYRQKGLEAEALKHIRIAESLMQKKK